MCGENETMLGTQFTGGTHPLNVTPVSGAPATLAIVMITRNEAHNMRAACANVRDLAQEIFVVDSFSEDDTVAIAKEFGVSVVQRAFAGFGDQWSYAVNELPIAASWTMKLDPDERLTPELISSIRSAIASNMADGFTMYRRLWFMGRPMPVRQKILRLWRTGSCHFPDVLVNEHPIVSGLIGHLAGEIEHHDSPHLHHWIDKQNRYTTAEARMMFEGRQLAAVPKLLGSSLERRMWMKRAYRYVPFRHVLMFLYCYFWLGAWRAGRAGYVWAFGRSMVFRWREYKLIEMRQLGHSYDGVIEGRSAAVDDLE